MENDMAQENERRYGIGKRVVPAEAGESLTKVVLQAEIEDEITEGKRFVLRPDGAGKLQGINPGAETVKREGAQKSSFGR
jgi:hypothetical protein